MIQADAAEKSMFARRATFAVLFSVTMAGSLWLAALALAPGGFEIFDLAALLLFAVTLPWMVAGFCNAVIGFVIMRFSPDAVAAVIPAAGLIQGNEPVTASTAILLCVRNEAADPHHPKPGTDARGYQRFGIRRALPPLPSQRYQRCRFCGQGRGAIFRIDRTLARSGRNQLSKAHGEYRFQGRQYPRVL